MLIPIRTDAPVYHAPWATVGVIVLNTVIQIWASATGYESAEPLVLHFGSFMPNQWLTSAFMHAGWWHLIGNMIFLWVFGLVVEGKIGWWRFLAVYGTIAAASGLIQQILMMGSEGASLGASGVIFGLLAIAMVWAPANTIDCLLFIFIFPYTIELSITTFAGIFLALQIYMAFQTNFHISSEVLHLIGAGCGLPIGILMLRWRWVDCEGWDWFSRRRRGLPQPRTPAQITIPPAMDQARLDARFRNSFVESVTASNMEVALKVWNGNGGSRWGAPVAVRERLVGLLVKANRTAEASPFIDGILTEDRGHPGMGLLRAQLLLRERRPAAALACLDAAAARLATDQQRALSDRLRAKCAALQAEGILEIAT